MTSDEPFTGSSIPPTPKFSPSSKRLKELETPPKIKAQFPPKPRNEAPMLQPIIFELQPLTILSFMQDLNRTRPKSGPSKLETCVLSAFIHDSKIAQSVKPRWPSTKLVCMKTSMKRMRCPKSKKLPVPSQPSNVHPSLKRQKSM
mmetsp:Transcript_19426/g.47474  ORF Transcript_19426/g.47474 Transcript_19426/m.47474 type:complete len:145 (+) Transcript_19426:210-644(+)